MIDLLISKVHAALSDDSTIEAIEKGLTGVSYTASGATIISGLTVNEWGVVVGMIIGVCTLAFNIWFKMKYMRKRHER